MPGWRRARKSLIDKDLIEVHDEPADDDGVISWARDFFAASAPYATGGVYVNFMTEEEINRVANAFGPNHQRLAEIKRDRSSLEKLATICRHRGEGR